jgi:hypothetical protein
MATGMPETSLHSLVSKSQTSAAAMIPASAPLKPPATYRVFELSDQNSTRHSPSKGGLARPRSVIKKFHVKKN